MNTVPMSITPKAIQDLLDELEASKQSRLRACSVLQRLRMVLSDGNVAIPPPAQKFLTRVMRASSGKKLLL